MPKLTAASTVEALAHLGMLERVANLLSMISDMIEVSQPDCWVFSVDSALGVISAVRTHVEVVLTVSMDRRQTASGPLRPRRVIRACRLSVIERLLS